MDQRLSERLNKIAEQIEVLAKIERAFLYLDAHRKVLFAQIYLKTEGKNTMERESKTYASEDWKSFVQGHSDTQALYNEAKRRYELKLNAYYGELAQYKVEASAIKKGVG